MAIFLDEGSRVIVQGITGGVGAEHTARSAAGGRASRGWGGRDVRGFGKVGEGMKEAGGDVSVVFVPPRFAKDAVVEAVDAEIGLAVVITEGIPVHDSAYFWAHSCARGNKTRIIGPNCPG